MEPDNVTGKQTTGNDISTTIDFHFQLQGLFLLIVSDKAVYRPRRFANFLCCIIASKAYRKLISHLYSYSSRSWNL